MKRRSAAHPSFEGGKWPRRPLKRTTKINSDNFYGGSLVYAKLLLLWLIVLSADYFLEFRFEYLWPFWLFLRSVYDSYKYQGLAFSVFFICIAVTSDMICYLFVPIHWLFFAASTYVWVQYVWHTEKGVCVPTIFLWLLFIYIEASIRLKEFKANIDLRNLPFHLDLCRPFAAHCIGYPVVTLGFGFKSYVGYRMRMRRQRDVQRENDYYYEFLRQALPPGQLREEAFNAKPSPKPCLEDRISAAEASNSSTGALSLSSSSSASGANSSGLSGGLGSLSSLSASSVAAAASAANHNSSLSASHSHLNGDAANSHSSSSKAWSLKTANGSPPMAGSNSLGNSVMSNGDCVDDKHHADDDGGSGGGNAASGGGGSGGKGSKAKQSAASTAGVSKEALRRSKEAKMTKEEIAQKLEQDVKRYKVDLQISRNKENDLRNQIISYMSSERHLKSEISNLQVEKSVLESRVSGLLSTRASEKAQLATLEKKLAEERKQKTEFQIKLETERKIKKEAANAERTAQQIQTRSEVLKLEADIKSLRAELQTVRERCSSAEQEAYMLRKYKETHGDPEVLVAALKATQEKKNQLEQSLSAETKLKMDLFSALGEAKRDLGIQIDLVRSQEKDIAELKAKIAEVLAVMPHHGGGGAGGAGAVGTPSPAGAVGTPVGGGLSKSSASSFVPFTPTTLALDLPQATDLATDLSFTGKLSSLGLSDLDGKLRGESAGVDAAFGPATFATNGAKNGDC